MFKLDVILHRCNETEPPFFVEKDKMQSELQFQQCAIIEKGMKSGQTVVAFTLKDPKTGNVWISQMAAELLITVAHNIKAAEERWNDNPM